MILKQCFQHFYVSELETHLTMKGVVLSMLACIEVAFSPRVTALVVPTLLTKHLLLEVFEGPPIPPICNHIINLHES